ncbi:MAG TPA: hypothetical protein VGG42_09815 [Acidobacteriaceae bacterium]|jgi:hypothetical protein
MRRFLERLFSWHFGPYAKCAACGTVGEKVQMYRAPLGYYCTEDECDEDFAARQW